MHGSSSKLIIQTALLLVTCINVAATLRSLSEWNVAATFTHVILHLLSHLYATYTAVFFKGQNRGTIYLNKYSLYKLVKVCFATDL